MGVDKLRAQIFLDNEADREGAHDPIAAVSHSGVKPIVLAELGTLMGLTTIVEVANPQIGR